MENQTETTGFIQGRLGVRLFYRWRAPAGAKGTCVLLHGFGEHSGRYGHVLDALAQGGFATLALDYRGHGRSEGRRAYVNRFEEFLDDAQQALDKAAELAPGSPRFLAGHSHGGLIAALYAVERGTDGIRALVLSGPAFEFALRVPSWKAWLGRNASKYWPTLAIPAGIDPAQLSRDQSVARAYVQDPLVLKNATARWYTEALDAQSRALGGAGRVTLPTLVMHGAADAIAAPGGSERFFRDLGAQDKKLTLYPGGRHEIFNETDRTQVLTDLVGWLQGH